jgi:hypothetical protein
MNKVQTTELYQKDLKDHTANAHTFRRFCGKTVATGTGQ